MVSFNRNSLTLPSLSPFLTISSLIIIISSDFKLNTYFSPTDNTAVV